VNASRSIITAWKQTSGELEKADNALAANAAREAAVKMRDEIRDAIK